MIATDVDVAVPTPLVFHPAGINLHEANATLDQSSGHQTLFCEVFTGRIIEAIELLDHLRLATHIQRLRRGHLHPIGQLKTLNPCRQLRLVRVLLQIMPIQPIHQIELPPLRRIALLFGPNHVVDRLALRIERCALIDTR